MNKKRKSVSKQRLQKAPGYGNLPYHPDEDIYNNDEKEPFIEEGSDTIINDDNTENVLTGEELDIPGAELDDADEEIGKEDEENNYYSLGGDNHDDLEESTG